MDKIFCNPDDSVEILRPHLAPRVFNAVRRNGIKSIGDLLDLHSREQLWDVRNLGEKGIAEIHTKLETIELIGHFSEPEPESRIGYSATSNNSIFVDLGPPTVPVHQVIKGLQRTLSNQIRLRLLHPDLEIDGQRLIELVETNRDYDLSLYAKLMNINMSSSSVADEIEKLSASLDERQIKVLLMRHGFDGQTLESVGVELGVTRERARQIENHVQSRLLGSLQAGARIRSAILYACNINLSFREWTHSLLKTGLLGDWSIEEYHDYDLIEMMIAICRITGEAEIPETLEYMIELHQNGKSSTPVRTLFLQKNLPREARRLIQKHLHHSGAVSVEWLAEQSEISLAAKELRDVLEALEYYEVSQDWYMTIDITPDSQNKSQVFHKSLIKMFQHCGPVEIHDVYFAIEHTLVRTDFPVPPIYILEIILRNSGYSNEDNFWFWHGSLVEELNRGEEVILQTLRANHDVAHHSELMAAIVDSPLSAATLHATLKRSPLFDRFQQGLYKLRGVQPDYDAIERARSAAERIPLDLKVEYDTYGNINVYATLSLMTLATGVMVSERLPNLIGEWNILGQKSPLRVTENEIRGLLPVMTDLDCEVGDRIQLSFNTWKRQITACHLGDCG